MSRGQLDRAREIADAAARMRAIREESARQHDEYAERLLSRVAADREAEEIRSVPFGEWLRRSASIQERR